ncbi:hypothetical protein AB0I54_44060 [Streptomyces sp. NPDC050625]|uniref:hypothetical protein n=1 Tax=Streptomyces sp. NPDC050625 TaxID=3154629 RepID=UPI00343E4D6F
MVPAFTVVRSVKEASAQCSDLLGDRFDVAPARCQFVRGQAIASATGTRDDDIALGSCQCDGDSPADETHPASPGNDSCFSIEACQFHRYACLVSAM